MFTIKSVSCDQFVNVYVFIVCCACDAYFSITNHLSPSAYFVSIDWWDLVICLKLKAPYFSVNQAQLLTPSLYLLASLFTLSQSQDWLGEHAIHGSRTGVPFRVGWQTNDRTTCSSIHCDCPEGLAWAPTRWTMNRRKRRQLCCRAIAVFGDAATGTSR